MPSILRIRLNPLDAYSVMQARVSACAFAARCFAYAVQLPIHAVFVAIESVQLRSAALPQTPPVRGGGAPWHTADAVHVGQDQQESVLSKSC